MRALQAVEVDVYLTVAQLLGKQVPEGISSGHRVSQISCKAHRSLGQSPPPMILRIVTIGKTCVPPPPSSSPSLKCSQGGQEMQVSLNCPWIAQVGRGHHQTRAVLPGSRGVCLAGADRHLPRQDLRAVQDSSGSLQRRGFRQGIGGRGSRLGTG